MKHKKSIELLFDNIKQNEQDLLIRRGWLRKALSKKDELYKSKKPEFEKGEEEKELSENINEEQKKIYGIEKEIENLKRKLAEYVIEGKKEVKEV